jgi:hypothetical protein
LIVRSRRLLKDDRTDPSSPVVHPSDYQEESVEPAGPVDLPRDVAVTRKRPAWLRDTLQDAKRHASPRDTFRERKRPQSFSSYIHESHIIDYDEEEQVAPPVVRQVAPPSTSSEELESEGSLPQDPVGRSSLPGQFIGDHTSEEVSRCRGRRWLEIVQTQRESSFKREHVDSE